MNTPSDITLLKLIEEYKLTVRPEFEGETATVKQWVVYEDYTPSLFAVQGYGKTLEAALFNFYLKLN